MPPRSQRNRACNQCRDRRVKCDERPETCNQCRRLGLACSGPLVGSIVIDMTDKIAMPRGRAKKETMRSAIAIREKSTEDSVSTRHTSVTHPGPRNQMAMLGSADAERVATAIRYQQRPPTFYQPSSIMSEALDAAFLAYYVQLHAGSRTYSPEIQWINHLPRIHAHATKSAVRLSLRAISMASYAKVHHDPSILVDSWRWYSVSLRAQRMSLSNFEEGDMPEEGEVLVPIILGLYELYCGTTAAGTMIHLGAAANIMNMRGPSNCRTGAIWPLFKGIRNADAHRAIIFGKPSVYSSSEWMTVPFIGMPRDAHQRLADIELMIPVCMDKLQVDGNLRVCFETHISPELDVEPCRRLTSKLMADLQDWAANYPNLTTISKDFQDTLNVPIRSGTGLDIANEDSTTPPSPDTFITLIASIYVATKLTLNMLLYKMATQASTSSAKSASSSAQYLDEACSCAEAILAGATYVEKAQTPGFDLLRSIAPLIIVVCIGPREEHIKEAREMLQRWGARVGGLGSILDMYVLSPNPTRPNN